MSRWIVFCLGLLGSATTLASELAELKTNGEKAVHCYYAHTIRMQFAGAMNIAPEEANTIMANVSRWQNVIQRELPDVAAQQAALQAATTSLSQRMGALRRDPNAMIDQVIKPLGVACDELLDQLDKPEVRSQPSAIVSDAVSATPTGPFDKDAFAGLLMTPRYADFRWNPHSDLYAKIKGRGSLRRIANGFRLEFETRIKTLCVGDLIETRRSQDGYLMHLKVPESSGEGCQPRVTHGLLFPMSFDEQPKNRRLMLRLYDAQNRLITGMRFESSALESKHLDPDKLMVMDDVVYDMQQANDDERRNAKLVNFRQNRDFPRLNPFYESCRSATPSSTGEPAEANYYCLCMTYKFGVGERIPEPEFLSYIEDFSRLTDQFRVFTDDNKMYTRLSEECRVCGAGDRTLRAGCDSPDTAMFLPNTFAGVIDQMEKKELRLESSTFYKEHFFVIYLQGYSNQCQSQIVDPVPFDYVVTETTTDPYAGSFTNEVQRDRTYVARRHAARYKAIYDKHAKMTPEQFVGAIRNLAITSEADLRRTQSDMAMRINIETEKRVAVRDHLAQGCTSAPVQRVYSRLSRLFE
ncbi:MAG: hypothetical protein AB8F65_14290 [Woeseiaceae bacterium]